MKHERIDCASFERLLASLLESALPEDEHRALADHLAVCSSCARLAEGSGVMDAEDAVALSDEAGEAIAHGIFARTTGSPCAAALERLCPFVDGELDPDQSALVSMHIQHCADCRATVECLRELAVELPALAEIDPGPGFTWSVLERTSRRAAAPESLGERIGTWWKHNIKRPRFALELAYSGAMVVFLLVGTPVSPFRDAPDRAAAVLQADPSAAARSVLEGDVSRAVSSGARFLFGETPSEIVDQVAAQAVSARRIVSVVGSSIGSGLNDLAHGRFYEAWLVLRDAKQQIARSPAPTAPTTNKKSAEPAAEGMRRDQ